MRDDPHREEELESRWEAAPAIAVVIGLQLLLALVSKSQSWEVWVWWHRPRRRLEQLGLRRQLDDPKLAAPGWEPHLLDYVYVAFTNAIAFSPTDVLPLPRLAKLLMLFESALSALTILLVAARAVNIFR